MLVSPGPVRLVMQCVEHTRNMVRPSHSACGYCSWFAVLGTFVRLGPNHISIAHPDALQQIYGHTSGATKSDLYDAFMQIKGIRSVFTTRDRAEHTRKRKLMSHTFSLKSVVEFEPIIRKYQQVLIRHWDNICAEGAKENDGSVGMCQWLGHDGRAWFDCLPCMYPLPPTTFILIPRGNRDQLRDIRYYRYVTLPNAYFLSLRYYYIGDLAFGLSFDMLSAVRDSTPVVKSRDAGIASYGKQDAKLEFELVSAIDIVSNSTYTNTVLGSLPVWARPLVRRLPGIGPRYQKRLAFGRLAVTAVAKRLSTTTTRVDMMAKLLEGRDEEGNPLGDKELTTESLVLLVAGSDTTAKFVNIPRTKSLMVNPSTAPCQQLSTIWRNTIRTN